MIFYEGPQFKLKLVRYYENLPFHYTGEVFRVQCKSANTVDSPGHAKLDPGWVEVGSGGAIGSASAKELVDRERPHYLIMDDRTLVTTGGWALKVSFDACGSFHFWDPRSLPQELIDPVDKPATCAPQGTGDCRHYDFLGERTPKFSQIQTEPSGGMTFLVR